MRLRSAGGSAMPLHVRPVAPEQLTLRPFALRNGRAERPQRIARKPGSSLRSRRAASRMPKRALGGPLGRGDPRHVGHQARDAGEVPILKVSAGRPDVTEVVQLVDQFHDVART